MKRDLDLVRNLLLYVENHNESAPIKREDILVDGYNDVQIGLHLNAMLDAGFIVGEPLKTNTGRVIDAFLVFDLTWKGHEYLDTIRDGEIWKKTQELSRKSGNATFEFAIEIAKALAKQGLSKIGFEIP